MAPSPEFPFCEPALHGVLVGLLGHAAAPSNVATMRCPEFFARLMGAAPPLFYPRGEHYYMQAGRPLPSPPLCRREFDYIPNCVSISPVYWDGRLEFRIQEKCVDELIFERKLTYMFISRTANRFRLALCAYILLPIH